MTLSTVFILTSVVFLTGCGALSKPASGSPHGLTDPTAPQLVNQPVADKVVIAAPPQQELAPKVLSEEPTKAQPQEKVDPIVERLLKEGEYALSELRLITPEEDSANLYFQAVLGRDPTNKVAQRGLATMVAYYTDWAWQKSLNKQHKAAEEFLLLAKLVNPDDPLIGQTTARMTAYHAQRAGKVVAKAVVPQEIKAPNLNQFLLPSNLFSLSDEEVLVELQPILDRLVDNTVKIDINWPIDKEARLLYQIINSRTEHFRVRAMIYHRQNHMIEIKQR